MYCRGHRYIKPQLEAFLTLSTIQCVRVPWCTYSTHTPHILHTCSSVLYLCVEYHIVMYCNVLYYVQCFIVRYFHVLYYVYVLLYVVVMYCTMYNTLLYYIINYCTDLGIMKCIVKL